MFFRGLPRPLTPLLGGTAPPSPPSCALFFAPRNKTPFGTALLPRGYAPARRRQPYGSGFFRWAFYCVFSTFLLESLLRGRPDHHPFELFLQLEEIKHRTTPVRRPQSNGIVERLHRTLLDEHFRIQGRIKFYESLEEMQTDLDAYFHIYNHERAHQGRNMNGRTPHKAFVEGIPTSVSKEDSAA